MLEYPDDSRFVESSQEFMFGSDLLVAPVLYPDSRQRDVSLPQGTWYDFYSGTEDSRRSNHAR